MANDDKTLLDALESLREEIARSFVLTATRLQETFDDSVRRGRITRSDAERLAESLLQVVRSQRRELLDDLEVVFDKGGAAVADVARDASRIVGGSGAKARRPAARPFPIDGYEGLNAKQAIAALEGLDGEQLTAVRAHELDGAARKTVLAAIDKRLTR